MLGVGTALVLLFLYARFYPTNKENADAPGFTPIRNDKLAMSHTPILFTASSDAPTDLYYRAARDAAGRIHITYHYVWPGEQNETASVGAFLSRTIYTGGLRLQRTMFGKGDIEMISLIIDKNDVVREIVYETAENYDPKAFGVKHRTITISELKAIPVFRVMSWNHLFQVAGDKTTTASETKVNLSPQYFTTEKWDEYEMWKPTETTLKKSRAHRLYERRSAE